MHGLHYSSWQARQTVGDNQECQKSRLGQRVGRGPVRILNYLSSPVHWHALPWENPTTLNGISHTLSAWYVPSSWTALCGPLRLGNTMVPSSRPELKLRSYVQELRSEPGGEKEKKCGKFLLTGDTTASLLCLPELQQLWQQ